jgi:alpha-galactosidase
MGWSSWYGFTQNINETMLREMGEGMISSGLHSAGYEHVWLDDGWAVSRDPKTGHIIEDRAIFPSGMKSLVAYIHSLDLKFGIYTSKGKRKTHLFRCHCILKNDRFTKTGSGQT